MIAASARSRGPFRLGSGVDGADVFDGEIDE
jgi:hypothetical protein